MPRTKGLAVLLMVAALGGVTGSAYGAGFALFEHGARAVALAGAFGAVADDPTAVYYNPAGIAFLDGTQVASGVYFIGLSSDFKGANPYPGQGYRASQEKQIFFPPHIFATGKLTERLNWGMGVTTPFGLGTWWKNDFAGRFISKRVDLKVFNFNPTVSFKVSDGVAFAVGADYFMSGIDITKSIGVINPYIQSVSEVGQVHLKARNQTGWGWNAALLAKSPTGWSAGATYRSKVKVNYDGDASFTQFATGHADFDAIVATQIPFATKPKVVSSIEFPDELRLALGYKIDAWQVSLDWVRMGWSSFKDLPITLVGYPLLSSVRPENYEDASSIRLGVEYRTSPTWAFQFGALQDKTPVPTASVSPLLPDNDRTGLSVGASMNLSEKTRLDVGYQHLMFKERSTNGLDGDNFNGSYKNGAELLGFTLVHRF